MDSRTYMAPATPGYAVFDGHGRLLQASPLFVDLLGEFAPGTPAAVILPVFQGLEQTLQAIAQAEAPPWRLAAVAHTPAGSRQLRYFDLALRPHAQPGCLMLAVRDVTGEAEAEQQAMQQRNERRMKSLTPIPTFDLAGILDVCAELGLMLAWIDSDLIVREATNSLVTYLERSPINVSLSQVMPVLSGLEEELAHIAAHRADPWRIPGLRLSEVHVWPCDVLFLPRNDRPGLIMAARQMQMEISVEQALRQQRNELILLQETLIQQAAALRTANERLNSLDRERRTLLDLIVHDIKDSLSIVAGYSEWLGADFAGRVRPEQEAALDAMAEGMRRMDALVEEVRAIERIEGALAETHWAPVDVVGLVREAVAMRTSKAALRGIEIRIRADAGLPLVPGDAALLQEAVANLFDNAMAARKTGEIDASISTWDRWLLVSLACRWDEGARHPKAPPPEQQASALLLARARLIAEGHGGHLSLEEERTGERRLSLWLLLAGREEIAAAPPARSRAGREVQPRAPSAVQPASNLLVVGEGTIRIHRAAGRVWVGDTLLSLSASEYRLLLHLAEHADQVVTHNQLLDSIWSYDSDVSLDNLRVLIWRLRQKLQEPQPGKQYLRTVRGFGYMLVA